MPFTKIVPADLQGKGVIGQPPVPGLSVLEMQESVEQIVREVAIPAVNRLVDELGATTAAGNIGAAVPDGLSAEPTVQDVMSAIHEAANSGKDEVAEDLEQHKNNMSNPHAVTAAQTGSYTKEETDAAIDAKVVQIGTADMAQAVYDPARLGVDVTVQTYTHTRSGTVHNFAGSGANGRALMTADVQAGDTFAVNGTPVTAYMGTDDATGSMAGSSWNGKWVSFIVEGGILNFKGGGGLAAADKAKLIPENIREGVELFSGTPREVVGTYAMSVKEKKTAIFAWNGTQKQSVTATYTVKKPCTVIAMSVIDFAAGNVTDANGHVKLNGSIPKTGILTAGWYLYCSVYMFTADQGDVVEVYSTAKSTTGYGGVNAIVMTDE